jgi:hypothetical protein
VTYAPASLQNLRSYLIGVGAPVLGIVGNPATHKGGYHVGKDRIYGPSGYGSRDYSIQTARDKAGLTNAASAIDIGRHARLIELGVYLRGKPDIRELIAERGDGSHIWRWVDGRVIGQGDSQELPHHLHVSYFRDSEARDKRPAFRAFYELPDTSTEEPMYSVPGIVSRRAPKGTPYYASASDPNPKGTTGSGARYLLVAQDKPTDPTRYLCDGVAGSALMSWLPASALTDPQDESYNAGIAAAVRAAEAVKRS